MSTSSIPSFIKIHQVVLEKKLKMWKFTDGRRTDGRTDRRTDGRTDGRCAMTIAHLSLRLRWAKIERCFAQGREPVSFSWHQNFNIIMDACKEYARRWAKKEDVEVDPLSEWVKSIADVLKRRIRRLKRSVNTRHESIFCYPEVVREISRLHENFVIVPADKASNNYTFVCKKYYLSILIEELGLNWLPGNPTYNLTYFSVWEVLDNHKFDGLMD